MSCSRRKADDRGLQELPGARDLVVLRLDRGYIGQHPDPGVHRAEDAKNDLHDQQDDNKLHQHEDDDLERSRHGLQRSHSSLRVPESLTIANGGGHSYDLVARFRGGPASGFTRSATLRIAPFETALPVFRT